MFVQDVRDHEQIKDEYKGFLGITQYLKGACKRSHKPQRVPETDQRRYASPSRHWCHLSEQRPPKMREKESAKTRGANKGDEKPDGSFKKRSSVEKKRAGNAMNEQTVKPIFRIVSRPYAGEMYSHIAHLGQFDH